MGQPFEVSQADRLATRALAGEIVESVRADREMPLPIRVAMTINSAIPAIDVYTKVDVEDFAMRMAQEIVALQAQLAAMTAARDEACSMIQKLVDAQARYSPPAVAESSAFAAMKREIDRRIAELRKVGAK